jgi:hypothetical protein
METSSKKIDKSISFVRANILSTLLLIPIFLILVIPYTLLWGDDRLRAGIQATVQNIWISLVIFVLGIVVHEWLHGITWKLAGRLPKNAITYGIKWKILTPYAHLTIPVTVETYRLGGMMPLIVLGMIPGMTGIITGSGWLLIFGLVFSWAATGDIIVWWILRDVPSSTQVEDHPDRVGCYMLIEDNSNYQESDLKDE